MNELQRWAIKVCVALTVVGIWTTAAVGWGYHWRDRLADEELKQAQADVRDEIIEKQRKSMALETVLLAKAEADNELFRLRSEQRRGGDVVYAKAGSCAVPVRFVSVWNSANQGTLADPASLADAGASGVELADIEDQHEYEAKAYRACLEVARGWQRYWKEVAAKQ